MISISEGRDNGDLVQHGSVEDEKLPGSRYILKVEPSCFPEWMCSRRKKKKKVMISRFSSQAK